MSIVLKNNDYISINKRQIVHHVHKKKCINKYVIFVVDAVDICYTTMNSCTLTDKNTTHLWLKQISQPTVKKQNSVCCMHMYIEAD